MLRVEAAREVAREAAKKEQETTDVAQLSEMCDNGSGPNDEGIATPLPTEVTIQ